MTRESDNKDSRKKASSSVGKVLRTPTSKAASAAAKVLSNPKSSKDAKSAAGSALTQRPNKKTVQILIRNVDAAVIVKLRSRAAESGTSLEEEARRALAAAAGLTRGAALARLDDVRAQIGRIEGPSTLEDLRRDRARDG